MRTISSGQIQQFLRMRKVWTSERLYMDPGFETDGRGGPSHSFVKNEKSPDFQKTIYWPWLLNCWPLFWTTGWVNFKEVWLTLWEFFIFWWILSVWYHDNCAEFRRIPVGPSGVWLLVKKITCWWKVLKFLNFIQYLTRCQSKLIAKSLNKRLL